MMRLAFAILALLVTCAAGAASPPDEGSPSTLAASIATQLLAESDAARAKTAAVSISGAPGLEGAPALVAVARILEDRIFAPSTGLTPVEPGAADIEVALSLSRTAGRIALGGAVRSRGARRTWVLASAAETPEWAPWLTPLLPSPADVAGFAWARVATLAGEVLDADGGDLDGDGIAELVAATRDELTVFRLPGPGNDVVVAGRVALGAGEAADPATRAPRALVRVSPGAGGPGEIWLRFTDERRTRVFAWVNGGLEPRGDREGLVLSARPTARGPEIISLEGLAPGTNHFVDPPKVKRGATWKTPASLGAWLDFRDADVTATARIGEAGASFALLGADGALRLLRSDLSELSRVPACGAAFALADWDADGKPEALCAGAVTSGRGDSLALTTTAGARWSAPVDGVVAGIAAGPQAGGGTAALAFVRDPDGAPASAVWLLSRRAP